MIDPKKIRAELHKRLQAKNGFLHPNNTQIVNDLLDVVCDAFNAELGAIASDIREFTVPKPFAAPPSLTPEQLARLQDLPRVIVTPAVGEPVKPKLAAPTRKEK